MYSQYYKMYERGLKVSIKELTELGIANNISTASRGDYLFLEGKDLDIFCFAKLENGVKVLVKDS